MTDRFEGPLYWICWTLAIFLVGSGSLAFFNAKDIDIFMGLKAAGSDPARAMLVGIRQLQYGVLVGALLLQGSRRIVAVAILLGGMIPLVDGCVAYSQMGWHAAVPHWTAFSSSFVLGLCVLRKPHHASVAKIRQ
ncbi:MAG: DUF4267 domain-containing protein [Xanthomonadaceae bacterium]|nr:DUF4267 domain-containing protein [Xanthomonadaceae bacterium]